MEYQQIFTGIYGLVLSWLSITIIQQGKSMAIMGTKLDGIEKSNEAVVRRFDLFLRTEIDTLKELAKH